MDATGWVAADGSCYSSHLTEERWENRREGERETVERLIYEGTCLHIPLWFQTCSNTPTQITAIKKRSKEYLTDFLRRAINTSRKEKIKQGWRWSEERNKMEWGEKGRKKWEVVVAAERKQTYTQRFTLFSFLQNNPQTFTHMRSVLFTTRFLLNDDDSSCVWEVR